MTDELMSEIKVPRTDGSIITVVGVGGAGFHCIPVIGSCLFVTFL